MISNAVVMLIEDHDELRDATVAMLTKAGYEVVALSCAEDVDDAFKSRLVDIYVVDLNLPEEDGISLTRRLRKAHPKAGIVITTARSHLNDRLIGYDSGADIYLSKPVDFQELLATIASLYRRLKLEKYQDSAWLLEFNAVKITGPQGYARLSLAEASLLNALASAPNQTLERWQAMTHLAGGEKAISSNSMQVRIHNLKKKLAACGGEGDTIISIRNQGYRMCFELQVVS